MKKSCFTLCCTLVIGLLLSCSYPLTCMAQGVSVTVPYASTDTSWWTGVAISNLDDSESTSDVSVTFYGVDGDLLAQENIGPIEPDAAYVDLASSIYTAGALPSRYKMVISHQGTQPLSATTFLGNAEGGFGYQTYANNTPGSEIASLPDTISSPGYYYIAKDLTCASGSHGITIEADNVTLDLMGFSLIGPGKDGGGDHSGVYMDGRSNVEIRNGTVREFPNSGIREVSSELGRGHRCINLRLLENGGSGLTLFGVSHLVQGCTAGYHKNSAGISTERSTTITDNTCYSNKVGILAGNGCIISDNTCYINEYDGIYAWDGITATGNACFDNGRAGLLVGNGSTITGNTCHNNGEYGISTGSGSTIAGNTSYRNDIGIFTGSGATIIGNTSHENSSWGMILNPDCFVDQNTVTSNDGGNITDNPSCTFGLNHAP